MDQGQERIGGKAMRWRCKRGGGKEGGGEKEEDGSYGKEGGNGLVYVGKGLGTLQWVAVTASKWSSMEKKTAP